jgi:hypothetical protein
LNFTVTDYKEAHYQVCGDIVTVGGILNGTPTAAEQKIFLTLPIPSSLASQEDLGGSFGFTTSTGSASFPGVVRGNATYDSAEIQADSGTTTGGQGGYSYSYKIR